MKAKIYRVSRVFHKYTGLILLLFIAWMSASGILLNHPDLISNVSVPGWMVPPSYYPDNWNISSLISGVQLNDQDESIVIAGKKGVWISSDGGDSFHPFMKGLPESDYKRKAYSVIAVDDSLFLGCEDGLYRKETLKSAWMKIDLELHGRPVKKLVNAGQKLFVMTDSSLTEYDLENGRQREVSLKSPEGTAREISLVTLFFDVHSGSAWGLAGKLLFDIVGLVSIFLCFTAFYIWYLPWRRKKRKRHDREKEKRENRQYKWHVRQHMKFGIWGAAILLIISFTGIFMRPPLLAIIAEGSLPEVAYPNFSKPDYWHKKLHNCVFEPEHGSLLLATSDGFFRLDLQTGSVLQRVELDIPVFVMGATVLDYSEGELLTGSFSGLYSHSEKRNLNLLTGTSVSGEESNIKPGEFMITGMMRLNDGRIVISAHEQGLIDLPGQRSVRLNMPEDFKQNPRLPLWNFMFELHNGRIFQDLIGGFYILLVPLGSILFFLLTVTGIYDWIVLKLRKKELSIE